MLRPGVDHVAAEIEQEFYGRLGRRDPYVTVHPEKKAPESVGWYIELTKWLIGVGAAVLVFGFEKLRAADLHGLLFAGFWSSACLLALATIFGIVCCMQFLAYANRKENGPKERESETEVTAFRNRGTTCYQICAGALCVGIGLFALTWAGSLLTGQGVESAGGAPVLLTLPGSASAILVQPPKATGTAAVLIRSHDGKYAWQAITALPPPPTPGSSMTQNQAPRAPPPASPVPVPAPPAPVTAHP